MCIIYMQFGMDKTTFSFLCGRLITDLLQQFLDPLRFGHNGRPVGRPNAGQSQRDRRHGRLDLFGFAGIDDDVRLGGPRLVPHLTQEISVDRVLGSSRTRRRFVIVPVIGHLLKYAK